MYDTGREGDVMTDSPIKQKKTIFTEGDDYLFKTFLKKCEEKKLWHKTEKKSVQYKKIKHSKLNRAGGQNQAAFNKLEYQWELKFLVLEEEGREDILVCVRFVWRHTACRR